MDALISSQAFSEDSWGKLAQVVVTNCTELVCHVLDLRRLKTVIGRHIPRILLSIDRSEPKKATKLTQA